MKKTHIMVFILLYFMLVAFFPMLSSEASELQFNCSVKSDNDCNTKKLLWLSEQDNNSHASKSDGYDYVVCCEHVNISSSDIGVLTDSNYGVHFISLSSETNAELSNQTGNPDYPVELYINTSALEPAIDCTMVENGPCASDYTCMMGLSGNDYTQENMHASTCDFYNKKLCCRMDVEICYPPTGEGVNSNYIGDDNDNLESDYDSDDNLHGDKRCPVSIEGISLFDIEN